MIQLPEIDGLTVRAIQEAVSAYYDVSMSQLISIRREEAIVKARHIAMWLAKRYTSSSYPIIGRMFGDRDHSTVMVACNRQDRKIRQSPELQADLLAITTTLAAMAGQDVIAGRFQRDEDPLQMLVDRLGSNNRSLSITTADLRLLLVLCASYAMHAGDIRHTDAPAEPIEDATSIETPVPMPMLNARAFDVLVARARAVGRTRAVLRDNLHTRFERTSREAFDAALDALDAQVNVLETGVPAHG